MKAIFRLTAFVAAVSMVAFSCAKIEQPTAPVDTESEIEEPADGDFVVTFECSLPEGEPESKTEFHGNTIWWSAEDAALFAQYAVVNGTHVFKIANKTPIPSLREVLSLTVSSFNKPDDGTDAVYFSVFPYASYAAKSIYEGVIYPRITLLSDQNPSAGSFDPTADLLISQYVTNLEADDEGKYSVKLKYKRMVAIAKMTVKNLPSTNEVATVEFSAMKSGKAVDIAGSRYYDLINGTPSSLSSESCYSDSKITLDYSSQNISATSSTGMTAYFMCYPFELGTGDSFKVVVTTTAGEIFTKEVTIPSGRTLVFNEGKGSIFSVSMKDVDLENLARYSNDGGNTWKYTSTLKDAIENATGTETQPAKVELLKDASHDGAESINLSDKYIEINGNGHTYDVSNRKEDDGATTANTVFYVSSNSTGGTASFSNITIDGKTVKKKSRLLFNNSKNNEIIFKENSSITNIVLAATPSSTVDYTYGIIYTAGDISLDGVSVSNCSSESESTLYGGFLYNNGAKISLMSGTGSKCSASSESTASGGFVYSTGDEGSVIISDDFIITECEASSYGGAVYIFNGSAEMNGGTISKCRAKYGGAIDCRSSFTMNAGDISDCSSTSFGGALYLSGSTTSTMTIKGGTIQGCSGTYGSICVNAGILNVKESSNISASGNNYAIGKSSNTNSVEINITGGLIKSDEAYAVYAGTKNGTVNISGGTIKSDNYRGVYLKACKLVMDNGLIDAYTYGIHNVYDKAGATILQINNGEIKSSTNYSIYFYRNSDALAGTLTITGGRFTSPSVNLYNTSVCQIAEDDLSITGGFFNYVSGVMSTFLKNISNDSYEFGSKESDGYRQVRPK